jgi:hypothetical protein
VVTCFAGRHEAWERHFRSVAQWLEHRSPKPGVGGSSPSTPAKIENNIVISIVYNAAHFEGLTGGTLFRSFVLARR